MCSLAKQLRCALKIDQHLPLVDISAAAHRYSMYKVGPVLCCSHGIGMPSCSVLLHELIKLVRYANCVDPIFLRLGTCGGLGVPPGSVVISKQVFDGYLRNEYEMPILGECVRRPANFNPIVFNELLKCKERDDRFGICLGNTMSTNCFYEGQARIDGAVCCYSLEQKMCFLNKIHCMGIKNIEMEALQMAAITYHCGIKAGAICVTLLNRLNGDQIDITKEQLDDFQQRPLTVAIRYIKRVLNISNCADE
ncbi:uridine phosphorylase 1-like isoform X2 [Teleopsis dalmanni]|nr:uridine phosphorylase 1-like isoform X2 [Teleopsis dalmanni]